MSGLDPELAEPLDDCDDADPLDDGTSVLLDDDPESTPVAPARRHLRADPRFRAWLNDADERVADIERSLIADDG